MKKTLFFIFVFLSMQVFSQWREYSGIVVDKSDQSPIPGVVVTDETGKVGVSTDFDGKFTIKVPDSVKVLIFSYFSYKPKKYKLGKSSFIKVELKEACNIDFFDSQLVGISLQTGILHTPAGGDFYLSVPAHFGLAVLKAGITYQTNFSENTYTNARLELNHIIEDCGFGASLHTSFRKWEYDFTTEAEAYSIESQLRFRKYNLYAGYAHIDFQNPDKNVVSGGLVLGLETMLIRYPLHIRFFAKTTIYNKLSEYDVKFEKSLRKGFYVYAGYNKLHRFNEVTLGFSYRFYYRLHKRKH